MQAQTAVSTRNKKGFTYKLTSFGKAFIDFASSAPKPVMDVGAAYGVASIPALEAGAKVIAVDVEEKHLLAIAGAIDISQRNRLVTLNEKFPDFDMPAESLSAVYMSQVLPFLKGSEIESGARKVYDWLEPGGKVFVVSFTPYISHVSSFIPLYEERHRAGIRWAGYIDDLARFSNHPDIANHLPSQIHHINADDLKWAFESAGFVIEEIRYFGEEEGALPEGIRMDGRERVGMIAVKPVRDQEARYSSHWNTQSSDLSGGIPDPIRSWLFKPYVLTAALKKVCDDFRVEITDQNIKKIYADEATALKLSGESDGYVRETYLGDPHHPLVYARVTMPLTTYQAHREKLDKLGNRPIGEAILYGDPSMTRSEIEVKRLTQNDELLFDAMVHENFYRAVIERSAANQ